MIAMLLRDLNPPQVSFLVSFLLGSHRSLVLLLLLLLLRLVARLCAQTARASRTSHPSLLEPDVEQRGHGLQLLVTQQIEQSSYVDEVDEAGVQLLVSAQMPELKPMSVVDVSITTQHLAVNVADVVCELRREARGLAQPVAWI